MARRLLDQDTRREQRRQSRLLDRLSVQFRGLIARDLSTASVAMVGIWRETRELPQPTELYAALERTYQQLVLATAMVFGSRVYEQGKASGYDLERKEDFATFMTRMALKYIGDESVRKRITGVTETTRDLIASEIRQGFADGDTLDAIADRLIDLIPNLSEMRASLIARTETHGAANYGANEAAKRTGLPLSKEWNSSQDANTRDSHAASGVDGQVVRMDENSRWETHC